MPTLPAPQSYFESQKRTEKMFCKCEVRADVGGIVMGGWSGLGIAEPEGQVGKGWKRLEGPSLDVQRKPGQADTWVSGVGPPEWGEDALLL